MPPVEEADSKGCIGRRKTCVVDKNPNIDSKTTRAQTQRAKTKHPGAPNAYYSLQIDRNESAFIRHKSGRIVRFSATFQRRSTIAILHYAGTAENAASISTSGITSTSHQGDSEWGRRMTPCIGTAVTCGCPISIRKKNRRRYES